MTTKVGYSTPLLHVAEIERSIRFYERLGFSTVDTDRTTPLGWARLHCEGGALMFLRVEEEAERPDPAAQGISACTPPTSLACASNYCRQE